MIWLNSQRGAVIDRFIDNVTNLAPDIMLEALTIGLGDLTAWFDVRNPNDDDDTRVNWLLAECGCLVGTATIAARNQVACIKPLVRVEEQRIEGRWTNSTDVSDTYGIEGYAPFILYLALVAATDRDISNYDLPKHASEFTYIENEDFSARYDPLLVEIVQAGWYSAEEVWDALDKLPDDTTIEQEKAVEKKRNGEVVAYMEERILSNLVLLGRVTPETTFTATLKALRAGT